MNAAGLARIRKGPIIFDRIVPPKAKRRLRVPRLCCINPSKNGPGTRSQFTAGASNLIKNPSRPYVITCLGKTVSPTIVAQIRSVLSDEGAEVNQITTLAQKQIVCIELVIRAQEENAREQLTQRLAHLNGEYGIDIAVQEEGQYRLRKRLIVMDMDSTLTEIEVIDELAKEAGVGEKVVAITRRAMNGELSFPEALRERVGLLKGLPIAALERVYTRMPFSPGAEKLIAVLKQLGFRVAVLSGGFDYYTSRVKEKLALDYTYSNQLEIKDGALTGAVLGDIVDGRRKVALMEEIAEKEKIPLTQVIAVGDGANDLPMIKRAGLGIAFDAKPAVRAQALYNLTHRDLSLILYLLGMAEEEIEKITQQAQPK